MDKEKPIMQPDQQHQLRQRREPLEQDNTAGRRRFQVLIALAFIALVGLLFLPPGSGRAIAQQGAAKDEHADHSALPARVVDLEAKLDELQNRIDNISSKSGPAGPQAPIHREDCYGFELGVTHLS
jgi:hypothetical protein